MESQVQAEKVRSLIDKIISRTIDPKRRLPNSGVITLQLQLGLELLPALFGVAQMDDERIVDYVVYQIYRMRTYIENGRWQSSWLFSQSALEKYRAQFLSDEGKSGINYYIDRWLDEAELSRNDLVKIIAKPKPNPLRNMVYLPSEEPVKMRFHNTPHGLTLCQRATTGWSPLSNACGKCDNWIECGKMTAKKYPELMRYRKEAYGKEKR